VEGRPIQPFNFFLAPHVKVPDPVITAAGNRLKRYFDRICAQMSPRMFSHSTFAVSPHAAAVGNLDLLAYVTQGSLIVALYDRVYEPAVKHSLSGTPGGGTKKMPNGGVLSEVFWTGGLMALGKADLQGAALANLIFHEFAHNKHVGDPTATKKGEETNGAFVHNDCGGGIFASGLSIGGAARLDINPDNVKSMARVLGRANRQDTCGLFNDELGF
jgi:hypothetical protein